MNHGEATLKKDLIINEKVVRKTGETGVITAFLPEYSKYAVMFDGMMGVGNWFSFDDINTFKEYFDYTLNFKEED